MKKEIPNFKRTPPPPKKEYKKENEKAVVLIQFRHNGENISIESDMSRDDINTAISEARLSDADGVLIITNNNCDMHIPNHVILTAVISVKDI